MLKKTQKSANFTNNFLLKKTISVIGYNYNYGRSNALNIKDNNYNVIVGTIRYDDDWKKAMNDGWIPDKNLYNMDEAVYKSDIVYILLPVFTHEHFWKHVKYNFSNNKTLCLESFENLINNKVDMKYKNDIIKVAYTDTHYMLRQNFLYNYEQISTDIDVYKNYSRIALLTATSMARAIGSDRCNVPTSLKLL